MAVKAVFALIVTKHLVTKQSCSEIQAKQLQSIVTTDLDFIGPKSRIFLDTLTTEAGPRPLRIDAGAVKIARNAPIMQK